MTELTVAFPGGERVEVRFGSFSVATDQDGTAPTPFDLFLASIGSCTGLYVARFCRQRGISTAGLEIRQSIRREPDTGRVARLDLDVRLPQGFPEKYRRAVVRAAEQCTVKRHLERPPAIEVRTSLESVP